MSGPHLASIDGQILPAAEGSIAITDEGLLRGDGAFEVIKLYGGRPFRLGDHIDRLERSASVIELSFTRNALEGEIAALLAEFGSHDGALRLVVTRGGRRLAICEPLPDWPETASLATVTYSPSVILTGVKSISYAANMQATRIAKARDADEALLVRPDGVVLEAPTSTIFWVRDGELRTPAMQTGILASITRALMIAALDVVEGEYLLDDLAGADEAFLASTTREIQGVSSLDGSPFSAAPGPLTGRASAALREAIDADLG